MRLFRGILVSLAALALLALGTASARAETMPAEVSLKASTAVTWPDQTGFAYQLTVKAGPEGADFNFSFPYPEWGIEGVAGTFVSLGEASLDGPGSLKTVSTSVADPSPTSCFRGGFGSVHNTHNLTLGPGEEATVNVPANLLAAPLTGMKPEISATLGGDGSEPLILAAPLEIGGTEGVRIRIESSRDKAKNWQRFTLTGQTFPTLSNRWIQVVADPRMWIGEGSPPKKQVILSVRTDDAGQFTSRPVWLGKSASWVLTSRLMTAGDFDPEVSCNGTVDTNEGWYRPDWIDLKGFTFVSTKVKGRNLGVTKRYDRDGRVRGFKKNRLRLHFALGRRFSWNIPHMEDWPLVPSVYPSTGCNRMGGEVTVDRGTIRADGDFFSTAMLCIPNNDSWIMNLLGEGLKGNMKNRMLVLKRGKTKITLKRRY